MLRVQIPFQDRDIPKMPSNDIVPVKYYAPKWRERSRHRGTFLHQTDVICTLLLLTFIFDFMYYILPS